jgi:endonuclease/exonuclease/phosphatase family metal-dependent hydrolase
MGKLAVKKYASFLTVLFSIFMLGISIFAMKAGQYDPAVNEFAAYVAFGKMFIVVIDALLLVYWLIRLKIWALLPLASLAVSYNFILSMYNPLPHQAEPTGQTLRVITYNVHSFGNEITGFSAKEFKEIMDQKKVDIVCFQEYLANGDFTYEDLRNLFSSTFPYYFQPKDEKDNVIFSRYPIVESKMIKFAKSNNGAVYADIDVNGQIVRVINVHMQTTTFNRMAGKIAKARMARDEEAEQALYMSFTDNLMHNLKERSRQARVIAELVKQTTSPIILCGDFNDTPGTYTYETLKGDLVDGFQQAGKGYAATYKEFHNLLRIDYIFHSPTMQSMNYETMNFDMSDHNPVFMEVGL